MLLSRKRGRELLASAADTPPHRHHHRHIDETWLLRDLLDAAGGAQHEEQRTRARRQVVEFLHRHNRIPEHAAHSVVGGSDTRDDSLQVVMRLYVWRLCVYVLVLILNDLFAFLYLMV